MKLNVYYLVFFKNWMLNMDVIVNGKKSFFADSWCRYGIFEQRFTGQ